MCAKHEFPCLRILHRFVPPVGYYHSEGFADRLSETNAIVSYRKVSVGLAWNTDNLRVVHLFEGNYVEYELLPVIHNGTLVVSGMVKNGAAFEDGGDLDVSIHYDPPPWDLTVGQLVRTYCYPVGATIAMLRPPASGDMVYFRDRVENVFAARAYPNPYEVDPESASPASIQQAIDLWAAAREASSVDKVEQEVIITLVTAEE